MSDDIKDIAQENRDDWAGKNIICFVENNGAFEIHKHTADSVCPPSTHKTKRKAAARILQLLHIGPVASQSYPEEVCIGEFIKESEKL